MSSKDEATNRELRLALEQISKKDEDVHQRDQGYQVPHGNETGPES